jgi:hypothetical protein
MILQWGPIEKLAGKEWYLLELRSEKTIESTMRRVGNAIKGIFREDPIEIFIPVFKRDLDVFEMKTVNLIFVRSTNFSALLRLKSVTGVVQLVTEGETNRPNKAIKVADDYVQGLITEAEREHYARADGIKVGSFVRILNGETRDFCGTVEIMGNGRVIVRVVLKTKSCLIETPVNNLLNLSHVPENQRVYYYGPLVEQLAIEEGEGLTLIAEDLTNEEASPTLPDVLDVPEVPGPKRHTRQRTVTALVKKLILIDNMHEPMEIAKKVVAALKAKDIKAPKNLFIVYCIIKDNLSKLYFKKIDPSITNYREVIHKYGRRYKFSANDIFKIDANLGIPVVSVEVCKDGRSREARLKQKAAKEKKTTLAAKRK